MPFYWQRRPIMEATTQCNCCFAQWGQPAATFVMIQESSAHCLGCKLLIHCLDSWLGTDIFRTYPGPVVVRRNLRSERKTIVTFFDEVHPLDFEWDDENCWGKPRVGCEIFYTRGMFKCLCQYSIDWLITY